MDKSSPIFLCLSVNFVSLFISVCSVNNNSESNQQETVNFSLVSWFYFFYFLFSQWKPAHVDPQKFHLFLLLALRTTTSIALHRTLAPQSRNSSLFFYVVRLSSANSTCLPSLEWKWFKNNKINCANESIRKKIGDQKIKRTGFGLHSKNWRKKKRTYSIILLRTAHTKTFASFFGFVSAKVPLFFLLGASYSIHGRCVRARASMMNNTRLNLIVCKWNWPQPQQP